jgi:6-phosphofructokinase 1
MHLDALVCLGGGGTQKNAFRLAKQGLNIVTLPKTIDNDVGGTDITFGFDTAMTIAAEAIDRLHSTADSHHRVIVVEVMGHNAGWLTLGAGLAGGADVILIPEIPYRIESVSEALVNRYRQGKRFSIVAVAEGAMSVEDAEQAAKAAEAGETVEWDEDAETAGESSGVRLAGSSRRPPPCDAGDGWGGTCSAASRPHRRTAAGHPAGHRARFAAGGAIRRHGGRQGHT